MQGIGLFLFGAVLLMLGVFYFVRAETVVNFFWGKSNAFSDAFITVAVTFVRIIGLFLLFVVIVLLCGIWTNS